MVGESNGGGDERPDWTLDHHCGHLSEHEVGTVGHHCDVHWGQGCEVQVLGPKGGERRRRKEKRRRTKG